MLKYIQKSCNIKCNLAENTNSRLRKIWPKGADMSKISKKEIDDNIFLLNITPRKVLNGLTPLEVFTGKKVALIVDI
ncbi:MAG: hypothetical protein CSB24_05325 [Deltaproteobacteria bacterium]|nr:MAG: hypothetical protein CSB24_05325 [Deltaproteobacteria bacterium]